MEASIKNTLGNALLIMLASFSFPTLRWLARIFSSVAWHGNTRIRKVVTTNITLCFPHLSEEAINTLVKQTLLETITTGMEMPRIWIHACHDDVDLLGGAQGLDLVDEALSHGKGLIMIGPHLGQWEYFILQMANRYPCTVLCNNADDIVPAQINDTISNGRMKTGATMVEARQGVKVLVEALKRGEIVMITPDQIPSSKNAYVFADFFGQSAATMTLISRLAKVSDARILSGFSMRQKKGVFDLIIKPVELNINACDLSAAARAMNKSVENLINHAPAQYLWTYKRFRLGPDGKRTIYRCK